MRKMILFLTVYLLTSTVVFAAQDLELEYQKQTQSAQAQARVERTLQIQARAEALLVALQNSKNPPLVLTAVQVVEPEFFGTFLGQLNTGEVCRFQLDVPEFIGDARFGPSVNPLPRVAVLDCPSSSFTALRLSPEGYVVDSTPLIPKMKRP